MAYVLAILLPPIGLLVVGKVGQAILNLLLICFTIGFGWPVAAIWAVIVVANSKADARTKRLENAIYASAAANMKQPAE